MDKEIVKNIDNLFKNNYNLPGYSCLTDLSGKIVYVNNNVSDIAGLPESHIVGRRAFCERSDKYAEQYKKNENLSMATRSLVKAYELAEAYNGRTFMLISHKVPFFHDGDIIGSYTLALEVPDGQNAITFDGLDKSVFFFDVNRKKRLRLTRRHRDVLYYLSQGLTAEEVARRLFLSKRTVQHYIEAIKDNNEYNTLREITHAVRII